jgi:hypothetical protein
VDVSQEIVHQNLKCGLRPGDNVPHAFAEGGGAVMEIAYPLVSRTRKSRFQEKKGFFGGILPSFLLTFWGKML